MRRLLPFILLLAMAFTGATYAASPRRTSKNVQQERTATRKKIDKTKKQIKTNIEDTRRELNRLTLLEGQIALQNTRIADMKRRADSIATESRRIADSVAATEVRVETLRTSYAEALRTIRRQRQTTSAAAFIFSAGSVSEAYRRIRYLRELNRWQAEKAGDLHIAVEELKASKLRLDSAHARMNVTVGQLERERAQLVENRAAAASLVTSLKRQGTNLNKVLTQQQEQARRLDEELNRIIEEEARRAAEEEARRKREAEAARRAAEEKRRADSAAASGQHQSGSPATPTRPASQPTPPQPPAAPVDNLTGTFEENKGKLPSPLDAASTVTANFGRFTHAELSKVELVNNGIDFETAPGASARAVFPGVVSMIIVMDGYHNVVLVRHGEYLTVYAGIDDLKVRKGQEVTAGQTLGRLFSDPNDNQRTRLHFEVRHEKEKLNPADWLK